MIAARIRQMTSASWLGLFGAILVAWSVLYALALPSDLRMAGGVYGAEFWTALCTVTVDGAGFIKAALMWMVMAAAMMLPTALPAITTYDDLRSAGADGRIEILVLGYLLVWVGFAIAAAALQLMLVRADLVSMVGQSQSQALSAALLAIAGLYQFSPVKEACLSKCRAPLTFFMGHFAEGPLRNGLRLGLVCLGCCWALMLLAFVGGTMSLGFMGLATVIMIFEKLPDIGRWLTRPLGAALIGAAVVAALV